MYTLLNVLKTMEQRISVRSHPHGDMCYFVSMVRLAIFCYCCCCYCCCCRFFCQFSPFSTHTHTNKKGILLSFIRSVDAAQAVSPSSRLRFFYSHLLLLSFHFISLMFVCVCVLYFIQKKSLYISACLAIQNSFAVPIVAVNLIFASVRVRFML